MAVTPLSPSGPTVRRLEPPRWSGSTGGAVLHAVGALAAAVAMLTEPAGDYTTPLWRGVAQMTAPAAGLVHVEPLHVWAVAMLLAAVAALAGAGRAWTAYPLAVLAVLWASLAGAALWLGFTADGAALSGGITFGMVALGAWRVVAALGRPRLPRPPREPRVRRTSVKVP